MSGIRSLANTLAKDTRIDHRDLQILRKAIEEDGKVTAHEVDQLEQVFERYRDAIGPDARRAFATLLNKERQAVGRSPMQAALEWAGGRGRTKGTRPILEKPELADVATRKTTLGPGAGGDGVKLVQRSLMALARLTGNEGLFPDGGANGAFSGGTEAAVKTFQSTYGLPGTGKLDQDTLRTLDQALQGARIKVPDKLGSDRLKGDATLEKVLDGKVTLKRGTSGDSVKKVQEALLAYGCEIKGGASGDLGDPTVGAVRSFQRSVGLPVTGEIDAKTLAALDKLAPEAGQTRTIYPEYDRIFADGVMDMTLGVGYDENGSDLEKLPEIRAHLRSEGFDPLDVSRLTPEQLRAKGIDPARVKEGVEYYHKTMQYNGRSVQSVVRLVTRHTPNAMEVFKDGMANSDVIGYTGHARYGSGPDFDPKASAQGNYVIGVNHEGHRTGVLTRAYNAHMREILKNAPNQLAITPFQRDQYQLVMFSGCKTGDYLDELRYIPRQTKDATNLDIIGTRRAIHPYESTHNVKTLISGLGKLESMNEMVTEMDGYSSGRMMLTDGFGDNRTPPGL